MNSNLFQTKWDFSSKILNTRLLGRFVAISYFIYKHEGSLRGFYKKNSGIFKIFKNHILLKSYFRNSIIHIPSLGSREVPQQILPDRFSRFDVYWIQTDKQSDKQTDKQTDKPNLYIDI